MAANKRVPNTITMSQEAWDRAESLAKQENRSLSNFLETRILEEASKVKELHKV